MFTVELLSLSSSDSENETTEWKTLPEKQGKMAASLPDESMIHKVSFQLFLLFMCVCVLSPLVLALSTVRCHSCIFDVLNIVV